MADTAVLKVAKFTVDKPGWVPEAMAVVKGGYALDIELSGEAALRVAESVRRTAASLPWMDALRVLSSLVPVVGSAAAAVPVQVVIPVLASLGGVGGAVGAAAFVTSVAVAHGFELSLEWKLGVLFDPTDDVVVFHLRPQGVARTFDVSG